jgi:DNA mismatch repair protein PMS2
VKKAARATVVCSQGKPSLSDNVLSVFGAKTAASLEPLSVSSEHFEISGLVSSAVKSGSKTNADRQFLFFNGRPVDMPKATRVVNDVYKCDSTSACTTRRFKYAGHGMFTHFKCSSLHLSSDSIGFSSC